MKQIELRLKKKIETKKDTDQQRRIERKLGRNKNRRNGKQNRQTDRQTDIDWFPHLFQTRPFNFLFQFTLARTRTTHADTLRSAGLARTVGRLYAWRVKQCGLSAGDLWRMFCCRTAIKSSAPTVPVVTVKAAILPSTWASELSGEARTSGKLGPSAGRGENQWVQQVSADCRTWKPKEVTAGKVGSENYLFYHPGAFWIESSGLKSHRRVNY